MIDKKTLANVRFVISWDGFGNHEEDEENSQLFKKSIKGYVELFNEIPKEGMWFENGLCDPARIALIAYNGIDNIFWVDLSFDL